MDCSGSHCGAKDSQYDGAGVGIWSASNTGKRERELLIEIGGLKDSEVSVIFANPSSKDVKFGGDLRSRNVPESPRPSAPDFEIQAIDIEGYPTAPEEKRIWLVPQPSNEETPVRSTLTTLRSEIELGGFTYKMWVADDQWTPNMATQIPKLAALMFGSKAEYGLLRRYLDASPMPPWGEYDKKANRGLIPGSTKEVHFVLASHGMGNAQFFDSSQTEGSATSNRALALFIGSDDLACQQGQACVDLDITLIASALANNLLHEYTHLVNYYNRDVKKGSSNAYDRWLEEATASSHGFVVASTRFPKNDASVMEISRWFGGMYRCPLTSSDGENGNTGASCAQNYYSSGQAFLLHLAQKYGVDIYKTLLDVDRKSTDAVNAAIVASGGIGIEDEFRRWTASLALLPSNAPSGFGYPGMRVGTAMSPPLPGSLFASARRISKSDFDGLLVPMSSNIIADAHQSGTYTRSISVPPGASVTVVVKSGATDA